MSVIRSNAIRDSSQSEAKPTEPQGSTTEGRGCSSHCNDAPEETRKMSEITAHDVIAQALETLEEAKSEPTGGKWLERLTAQIAPYVKEWDISDCWTWAEWPDREMLLPETTSQDNGIDAVAVDRSNGSFIAIQCKSRQLDETGHGRDFDRPEITSFISESDNDLYAERWLITNGDNRLNDRAERTNSQLNKKIKVFNLHAELTTQKQGSAWDEECPHCQPNPDGEWRRQSKTCMQTDAVGSAVSRLRGQLETDLDGIPIGQARGKIILPCGTGKTRISLRIVEELTPLGGLSVVLCPSIALVAQIRREYRLNSERHIRALAVCSDETAGYDPKKEDQRNTFEEVTADSSNVSANEIKGKVTTDPEEIARWIGEGEDGRVSVIFGTYQSGHRIAEGLRTSGTTAEVLICDEAHRTAGLRRTKRSTVDQIKDFTLCHDNEKFPAKHRIYQTATPKIYTQKALREKQKEDWVVRNMDDQSIFGPDLFRRSYRDAVNNEWLSDYRIIAVGISGSESHEVANTLASTTESKGRNPLTSTHFLRGLAFTLAMGGATKGREHEETNIQSCIAFMNTVDKSNNMVKALDTEPVRNWLRDRMREMDTDKVPAAYTLDHLDASSNVAKREEAKARLAEGTLEKPHGVINVGIFGEGTDSPSLSAVAFLEARRSPIDVVQAVGRAMRTSPGKDMGYVICPIVIPLNADAENFLKTSNPQDGWKELGDILLALRAHDERIEDRLAELMTFYLPPEPEVVKTIVGIAHEESKRMSYWEHVGKPGAAELALQEVLNGTRSPASTFEKVSEPPEPKTIMKAGTEYLTATTDRPIEPSQTLSGKRKDNGEPELRKGGVEREKPDDKTGMPGKVDIDKTKNKIIKPMVEGKVGTVVTPTREHSTRRTQAEISTQAAMRLMELDANEERSKLITMNLLEKSGLRGNRPERDANMIQDSIYEAAHQLRNDRLKDALDRHFNLNYLDDKAREDQADGCTIAALLLMNAAMLHQRISAGRWLDGVESLDVIKNSNNPVSEIKDQWNTIRARDFRPVIEPALEAIRAVERTGRTGGLFMAVRHIAKEAEELAASYADLGADHAGPLFNRVMGNQASDGAYFTRPAAASIAARLTLDALGEQDWTDEETWRSHKTVDLACGSGTLLTAMLTEMKRRAKEQGATESEIGRLQKTAVEDTLKGMDINPISLQLAASQLTTGNQDIGYRRMGLHRMPYGPDASDPTKVSSGTLELLGQKEIVQRTGELNLPDDRIASEEVWTQGGEAMEDAVDAVKGEIRIVIMNPPFTNRSKMGEKFPDVVQQALRKRTDSLEDLLVKADPELKRFASRNTVRTVFRDVGGPLFG